MALVRIGFDVAGEQQVSRALDLTSDQASDLRVPLGRMADEILAAVRLQYATQGQHGLGARWTPLSDAYAAWKLARFGPKPILVRTGGSKGAALNRKQSVRVTKARMVYEPVGKAAEILGYHQAGTEYMPARPVLKLTTEDKRLAVDRVFSKWLHEVKTGAFAG